MKYFRLILAVQLVSLVSLLVSQEITTQFGQARAELEKVAHAYPRDRAMKLQGYLKTDFVSADSETNTKQNLAISIDKDGRFREQMGSALRVADGRKEWTYLSFNKTYNSINTNTAIPQSLRLFGGDVRAPQIGLTDAIVLRQETVITRNGDVTCDVIEASYDQNRSVTFWIDHQTGLLWKIMQNFEAPGRSDKTTQTVQFSSIDRDPVFSADAFKFTPPEGAKESAPAGPDFGKTLLGRAAPGFKLQNLAGKEVELASFKGKIVVLDFWATWCGPCRAEIPKLDQLSERFADSAVVLGIDAGEEQEIVQRFVQENKMKYDILLAKPNDRALNRYGANGLPTVVIIDKNGIVSDYSVGSQPDSEGRLQASLERISRPGYTPPAPLTAGNSSGTNSAEDWPQPKTALEFLQRSSQFRREQNYARAVEDASAALKLKPGWEMALHERAEAHYAAKEYADTIADSSAILRRFPDWAPIWNLRGLAKSYSGHHDEAISDYTQALKLSPYSAGYFGSRGWAYLELSDLIRARKDLDRAIELSPELTKAYENRAKLFGKSGNPPAELADLDTLLRIQPGNEWAKEERAKLVASPQSK